MSWVELSRGQEDSPKLDGSLKAHNLPASTCVSTALGTIAWHGSAVQETFVDVKDETAHCLLMIPKTTAHSQG